jgi:hypothetical protein
MLDKRIEPKFAEEKIIITYDFSSELGSDTLTGTPVVTVEPVKGNDATPAAMLNGQASIVTGNQRILQPIQGGIKGNAYRIKVTSQTTNALLVLTRSAIISIE